jgi:predicted kinase
MLIVFGGLPGTGKTTLARALAQERRATYLRIDTIEQALRASGMMAGDMGPAGYMVAYALAEANLRLGRIVVSDSVNPLAITRDAWLKVASEASSAIFEIEVVCSNADEHRRRIETRTIDVPGLVPPTWRQVVDRNYEPWNRPHLVLDTANRTPEDALEELRARIDENPGSSRSHTEGTSGTRIE